MDDSKQLLFDFAVPHGSALETFVRDLEELARVSSGGKKSGSKTNAASRWQWPSEGVHGGDCIQGMQQIPEGSVDLVFADPPFNIGYEYDEYDDRKSVDEYLNWCTAWMSQVRRVLKPTGAFWLAIGDDFAAELKVLAQRVVGFHLRSWVVWYYTFGVNCKRKFTRSHTHLLYFTCDPNQFTFNQDDPDLRIPSARQLVYGDRRANPKGRLPDDTWILRPQDVESGFGDGEDCWYFPRVAGTFKQRAGFHGCQMPEQLLARVIRSCSDPDQWVLDPFAGSGSTLLVAKKLGRKAVGFELSKSYVKEIKKRWKETNAGDELAGAENPLDSAPKTGEGRRLDSRKEKKDRVAEKRAGETDAAKATTKQAGAKRRSKKSS